MAKTSGAGSRCASSTLRFGKQQMYEELADFMRGFARSVERMYGTGTVAVTGFAGDVVTAQELDRLQESPLWRSLGDLYDYGVDGVAPISCGLGDGSLADTELFVMGLDSLALYLEEDDTALPRLAKLTVERAHARHLLDGGQLYADLEPHRPGYHLSLRQLALLAWSDEASLVAERQPQGLTRLTTIVIGGRGYVHFNDARRWLAFAERIPVALPIDVVRMLSEQASESGTSTAELLRSLLANAVRGQVPATELGAETA